MDLWKPLSKLAAALAACCATAGGLACADEAAPLVYRIALVQDLTETSEAARAIEYGLRAALVDVDPMSIAPPRRVEFTFETLDHRTNIYRAKQLYVDLINDQKTLINFAGVHSPPLIRNRRLLNENGVLTLVPWAAGGPVTRATTSENWVFRLSVDDRKAGAVIVDYGVTVRNCRDFHLYLVDNPWGRSNAAALRKALAEMGRRPSSVQWIPWRVSDAQMRRMVSTLDAGARDCVLLVSSAHAAKRLVAALMELPEDRRPSLLSHWGLASNRFAGAVPYEVREALGLRFIQSCHNLFSRSATVATALERLRRVSGGADWATAKIPATPGFVHAYDLGLLLVAALRQAELTGDIKADRAAVRAALTDLEGEIEGLIKTYRRPFAPYKPTRPDAHEALVESDLCMGWFDKDDAIRVENMSDQRGLRK